MHNAKKHTARLSPSGTYSSYCNIHPHMKITGIHMSVFSKSHEVITICFGMWADQELLSKQYHCASICIIAGSWASGFCSKKSDWQRSNTEEAVWRREPSSYLLSINPRTSCILAHSSNMTGCRGHLTSTIAAHCILQECKSMWLNKKTSCQSSKMSHDHKSENEA